MDRNKFSKNCFRLSKSKFEPSLQDKRKKLEKGKELELAWLPCPWTDFYVWFEKGEWEGN